MTYYAIANDSIFLVYACYIVYDYPIYYLRASIGTRKRGGKDGASAPPLDFLVFDEISYSEIFK